MQSDETSLSICILVRVPFDRSFSAAMAKMREEPNWMAQVRVDMEGERVKKSSEGLRGVRKGYFSPTTWPWNLTLMVL